MQSLHQDALLQLFLNRPQWAVELVEQQLLEPVPFFTAMRIEPVVLLHGQQPHRAYAVVLLVDQQPVFGIVLAIQLVIDEDEAVLWPLYAYHLYATLRCAVAVLVIAPDAAVAHCAGQEIHLGPDNYFRPWVVGPTAIPQLTAWDRAKAQPELAILSALAHGRDADTEKAVSIALNAIAASVDLDPTHSIVYVDLIYDALSEAAKARATRPENFSAR